MRRPKHRRHPDIWRARHMAENAWLTRRLKAPPPTDEEMRRCVLRVWETALTPRDPQPRTLTEAEFLATLHAVWNDLEPLGMETPYTPGRVR